MDHQQDNDFINYYEVLNIAEDASFSEIEVALEKYQSSMTRRLGNPLNMQSARYAINVMIPQIKKSLQSNKEAREAYDQTLALKRKQSESDPSDELQEHEGLDQRIQQPFFFDPYSGYDTEPAIFTLRDIASRLDEDWTQTRIWFMDRSSRIHPLIGYLTYAALRPQLAKRIEQIMELVKEKEGAHMDINEAIERSITIFNPDISRPSVSIESPNFDGRVLDTGTFLPDPRHQAQSDFTLQHQGMRGCVFGTVESHTPWITFSGNKSLLHFSLMPEETVASSGLTKINIPLFFQFRTLPHKAEYIGELTIRLDNYDPPLIKRLPILLYLAALPPRVWFEPASTAIKPLQIPSKRQGDKVTVIVTPRNGGDERYIPLTARVTSEDGGASASPEQFRANQPITLSIDTSNRPRGKIYDITYNVDYRQVNGAEGEETIYVRGEIIPNFWQSIHRAKTVGNRLVASFLLGIGGFFLLGAFGNILATNIQSAWILFFLIPLLLLGTMNLCITPIIIHIQRSGTQEMEIKKVSPYIRWALPLILGIVLVLVCGLIHNSSVATEIGGFVGILAGMAIGFLRDGTANQK